MNNLTYVDISQERRSRLNRIYEAHVIWYRTTIGTTPLPYKPWIPWKSFSSDDSWEHSTSSEIAFRYQLTRQVVRKGKKKNMCYSLKRQYLFVWHFFTKQTIAYLYGKWLQWIFDVITSIKSMESMECM